MTVLLSRIAATRGASHLIQSSSPVIASATLGTLPRNDDYMKWYAPGDALFNCCIQKLLVE